LEKKKGSARSTAKRAVKEDFTIGDSKRRSDHSKGRRGGKSRGKEGLERRRNFGRGGGHRSCEKDSLGMENGTSANQFDRREGDFESEKKKEERGEMKSKGQRMILRVNDETKEAYLN